MKSKDEQDRDFGAREVGGSLVPENPASLMRNPQLSKNLAVDVALGTPEDSICEAYGILHHELVSILNNAQFIVELAAVRKSLEDHGEKFKLMAQLQAEQMLGVSWAMVHNPFVSDSVRADLIKSTVRWAGHEKSASGGSETGRFTVNIDLSNATKQGVTIEGSSE